MAVPHGGPYPDISHMMKPPELKCPQFPFLHQPIAVRTTTATTAEVKNTRHRSWLLHLHSQLIGLMSVSEMIGCIQ